MMTENTQSGDTRNRANVTAIDFGSTSSAAAMFRQRRGLAWVQDPNQARIVRRAIVGLLEGDWPGPPERLADHYDEIRRAMDQLSRRDWDKDRYPKATDTAGKIAQLAQILRDEDPGAFVVDEGQDPPIIRDDPAAACLDITWIGLARLLVDPRNHDLATWGMLWLHETALAAFTSPAFAIEDLYPVEIDIPNSKRTDIPSVLRVTDGDLDEARLTAAPIQQLDRVRYLRGFKRGLFKSGPLPAGLHTSAAGSAVRYTGSDLLIGQAYQDLKKRTEHYGKAKSAEEEIVDQAVITYPTTAPPSARARLAAIAEQRAGIAVVITTYDEAVASVLFTLMRDFGGNMESGIETFRARSRPFGTGSWRQNLLVIDIGGGTTDIAFTSLRLTDETSSLQVREGATAPPRTKGRIYRLHPRVLGATGHPQMGGDLLTLRIFYWIKAVMADGVRDVAGQADSQLIEGWPLTAADGGPAELAPAVVGYKDFGPAPAPVAKFLREFIPTKNRQGPAGGRVADDDRPQLTDAFEALWRHAEEAKKWLARDRAWSMPEPAIEEFAGLLGRAPYAEHIPGIAVKLTPADFVPLARPVLGRSVDLAVDLVMHLLRSDEHAGEQLDGVTLTGRAAGVPLVRELLIERLAEAFGEHDPGHRLTPWNPSVIRVESTFPKAAASLGACWAEVQNQNNQRPDNERAGKLVESGSDQLRIVVDNLILNMPCRFGLGGRGRPTNLFSLGYPLDRVDWRGNRYAASTWEPATPDIRLERFLDDHEYIEWGRYTYRPKAGRELPAGVYFQIELDQGLKPSLLLCRGEQPYYVLDGAHIDLRRILSADLFDEHGRLRSLPEGLAVRGADRPDGSQTWRPVFNSAPGTSEGPFPDTFSTDGTDTIAARIAATALPVLESDGQGDDLGYSFGLASPEELERGEVEEPFTVPAPGRDPEGEGRRARREGWAVLDASGVLHVLPGFPRYLEIGSLDEMEAHPGCVYRTDMDPPVPFWDADYDPFTGEH